ncbi:MAG TPA: hypothetical protein VF631_13960 [Allosphingosinicella sp.]|jgi:hypothetical protein|uniref:hypothetical protein n=1 Tax=Allosphingosinicella sp. TaxID=2823234 RepID=UPI002F2A1F77
MRIFLMIGAALTLSACGGGGSEANDANMAASGNMTMDQNMTMDPMMNGNMGMDPMMNGNMATDPAMNGMANGAADPATQNAMQKDMNANDPDTNLANGM